MISKGDDNLATNNKVDSTLKIAEEDEDFITSREGKYERQSEEKKEDYSINKESTLKFSNTKNLNLLLLSCVKNEEYCYTMLDYMKKLFHFSQIDYYLAYTQILYCFKPKEINEMAKIRKHLKNQWSRDDPGFLLVLIYYLAISSFSFCMTFQQFNAYKIFQVFIFQAFFCLIIMGLLISLVLKNLIEKYFKNEDLGFNRIQTIEYQYAFDVHCNGFVPFYFFAVALQFILIPVVISDSLISVFISNGLFISGIMYYAYVTLLGYYSKFYLSLKFLLGIF